MTIGDNDFNTDQGSQFTSEKFTKVLKTWDVKISMDGKGRFKDNIFIERLWRTLKYDRIYLKAYETGTELSKDLTTWFSWYNEKRKHSSLDKQTPDEAYYRGLDQLKLAPLKPISTKTSGHCLFYPSGQSHKPRPPQITIATGVV